MKRFVYIALTVCVAAIAYAAIPPSSYSLNFHFIPPLVQAPCTFASVWNPANMTCAMCFCLNGRISRCVPQPGCSPLPNATTTTQPPPGSGPNVIPGPSVPVLNPDGMPSPPVQGNATVPQPPPPVAPGNSSEVNPPANNTGSSAAPVVPTPAPGRFRHAKLGKTFEKH